MPWVFDMHRGGEESECITLSNHLQSYFLIVRALLSAVADLEEEIEEDLGLCWDSSDPDSDPVDKWPSCGFDMFLIWYGYVPDLVWICS